MILLMLIVLIFECITYQHYMKRIYNNWIISTTCYIYMILENIGFIIIFGIFISILNCNNGSLRIQPDINCNNGLYYASIPLVIIIIIPLVLTHLIISYICIETTNCGKRIYSRNISNIFILEQVTKLILTILSTWDNNSKLINWIIQIIMTLSYGHIFYTSIYKLEIYKMNFANTVFFNKI